MKVTNNRKAAHTIFTKAGPVRILAGGSADVDITAAEAKEIEAAGLEIAKAGGKKDADETK